MNERDTVYVLLLFHETQRHVYQFFCFSTSYTHKPSFHRSICMCAVKMEGMLRVQGCLLHIVLFHLNVSYYRYCIVLLLLMMHFICLFIEDFHMQVDVKEVNYVAQVQPSEGTVCYAPFAWFVNFWQLIILVSCGYQLETVIEKFCLVLVT